MAPSRREACMMIPAMMMAASAFAADRGGRSSQSSFHPGAEEAGVLPSKIYNFDEIRKIKSHGNVSIPILEGKTHTGFPIELHETELPPGGAPHPPHRHPAEELFLIRDGIVEVTINGKSSKLPGGSVAYIASNDLHGIRNAGSEWARYFVMQLNVEPE